MKFMTKDSAKQLMDSPVLKLCTFVAGICSLYFGLRSEIRENKATQTGIDNVQNLQLGELKDDVSAINTWRYSFSQPAMKPKPITIPSE